jgi:phage/plasmid-associated DNA primase
VTDLWVRLVGPRCDALDWAHSQRKHLIPFAVTIPPSERDGELSEKLKAEWPGILAWLIQGALEWQTEGLHPPLAVLEATETYLAAEDALAAWMDEKCERDGAAWTSSTDLFASWSAWANLCGESPGTMKGFAQALEARGLSPARTRRARFLQLADHSGEQPLEQKRQPVTLVTPEGTSDVRHARARGTVIIRSSVTSVTRRTATRLHPRGASTDINLAATRALRHMPRPREGTGQAKVEGG